MLAKIKAYFRSTKPKVIIAIAQRLLHVLFWTCRKEIHGLENLIQTAQKGPCVLMLWHDRLTLVGPMIERYASQIQYAALVSASRDGRLVTEICESYPNCRVIQVAHDGRHHALREVIHQLRQRKEVLIVTPDGPRGPRHRVKPGIIMAARIANVPIIPFTWSSNHFWQLNTWDKLGFPKPFSSVTFHFGTPLMTTGQDDEKRLEQELERLTREETT